jgi:hypothetical protein
MLSKNVINEVVKEWSWRVPTGMPDVKSTEHLNILRDILITDFRASTYTVNQVIHSLSEAKKKVAKKKVDKVRVAFAKQHSFFSEEQANKFYDTLTPTKRKSFSTFMKTIPSGDATNKTQTALGGFTDAEITEFAGFLWSRANPKSEGLPSSGAAGKLFDLKPDGAGRGEIYLAAVCKNSYIQGSSESFDLQTSSKKYEIKDYSKLGGSIRAGVEAAISKFYFWKQILKTIDVIKAVEKENGWDFIPDSSEKTQLLSIKDYILDRVDKQVKIVTGEYNKTDQKNMLDFYAIANNLLSVTDTSFNQVVFRGPNQKPTSFSIEALEPTVVSAGKKITIELTNKKGDLGQLINYLNRLDYVRSPSTFTSDIDAAIKTIIEGGKADSWIIFRKSGMKIVAAKASNFQYESISQNGVKFSEV